jgi:hypothetical protein
MILGMWGSYIYGNLVAGRRFMDATVRGLADQLYHGEITDKRDPAIFDDPKLPDLLRNRALEKGRVTSYRIRRVTGELFGLSSSVCVTVTRNHAQYEESFLSPDGHGVGDISFLPCEEESVHR